MQAIEQRQNTRRFSELKFKLKRFDELLRSYHLQKVAIPVDSLKHLQSGGTLELKLDSGLPSKILSKPLRRSSKTVRIEIDDGFELKGNIQRLKLKGV